MTIERRRARRTRVGFHIDQYVDNEVSRCFVTDVSSAGLYMERSLSSWRRGKPIVQLDIPLPGLGESIWVSGTVVYDRLDGPVHGCAVRFLSMASTHARWLREFLHREELRARAAEAVRLSDGRTVTIRRPTSASSRTLSHPGTAPSLRLVVG